jgi:hypothetical protein
MDIDGGQMLKNWVTVGIATKNRWEDIEITLEKIGETDLQHLPIIILDDCSDIHCPFDLNKLPLQTTLNRFTESEGYIVRRNQLAHLIQTKYYFSLDDDSFPVSGSLEKAIEFAESRDDVFCLSFPIYNPVIKEHQNCSLQQAPYRVRSFIGCGHLLHIPRFLELGGYREELIHQGEEMEIAARAFQRGWYCYHFPSLKIHHTVSTVGRNWHRMDFYGARNNVLWNDWFVPNQLKLIKQSRTFISRIIHSAKAGRLGQLQGEFSGLKETSRYKNLQQAMSLEVYKDWTSLPFS